MSLTGVDRLSAALLALLQASDAKVRCSFSVSYCQLVIGCRLKVVFNCTKRRLYAVTPNGRRTRLSRYNG